MNEKLKELIKAINKETDKMDAIFNGPIVNYEPKKFTGSDIRLNYAIKLISQGMEELQKEINTHCSLCTPEGASERGDPSPLDGGEGS